jgi:hypothetical protein
MSQGLRGCRNLSVFPIEALLMFPDRIMKLKGGRIVLPGMPQIFRLSALRMCGCKNAGCC